jgi:hypothetical protein
MTPNASPSIRPSLVAAAALLTAGLLSAPPPGALAQGTFAEPPAALVLDVSGTVSPAVQRHTEVPGRTSLALNPSGRITFVHYRTCRVVTVAGGTVRILPTHFEAEGGRIESDRQRPCPRQQKLPITVSGQPGALVTRGITRQPALPILTPQPRIVLVGSGASRIREGRCTAQHASPDQPAHPMTIADGVATPAQPLPLGNFTCELTTGDGRSRARLTFQVVSEPTATDLVVATVD